MKLNLLKSKKEELEEIANIYMNEFSKPPYNEKWTFEKAIFKIKFFYKYYNLYTIKIDNKIIGFICVNPNFMCPGEVAFGEEMAIKEEYQNKGIGTWVIKEILKIYEKRGFRKFTGIVSTEPKILKFYEKVGLFPSKKDIIVEKRFYERKN